MTARARIGLGLLLAVAAAAAETQPLPAAPSERPIVILVSIDGTRDALQAIIDGKLGATVECSPHFGPKAYDTLVGYANGEEIPPKIINPDRFFDKSNAAEHIDEAY